MRLSAKKNHFAGAGKMVDIGSQTDREIEDWHLSRFACYLIAQNKGLRKPEIAKAQKYFAMQTRRQEISDQMSAALAIPVFLFAKQNNSGKAIGSFRESPFWAIR